MPVILSFDVGAGVCEAALCHDSDAPQSMMRSHARGQEEILIPLVADLLAAHRTTWGQVDCIAVNVGPGSFTGIRVGLAAALGLAFDGDKIIMGVSSLAARAASIPQEKLSGHAAGVAELSGKGGYHIAWYNDQLETIYPPHVSDRLSIPSNVGADKILWVGNAASAAREATGLGAVVPESEVLLAKPMLRFARIHFHRASEYPPQPLYLREADVTIKAAS